MVDSSMAASGPEQAAREARDSTAVQGAARLGFLAYGVVYLVIAWLAGQLALGNAHDQASRDGAFAQLADQPLGRGVLWVAVAGFAALVIWELCQALVGHRDQQGWRRWTGVAGSAARAVVFATFGISAARVALGSGASGSGAGATATVLGWPLGPLLVGLVGAGVVGYGAFSVGKGLTDKWRTELDAGGRTGHVGRALAVLARVGYVSRGVAFGVMGALLVWAAADHDPSKGGGLDTSLRTVRDAPLGSVLLLVVAVGLGCYGVFNIAKARHLRRV